MAASSAPINFDAFDHADHAASFVVRASAAVAAGLVLGAALDAATRKLQGADATKDFRERQRARALAFFVVQTLLNIAVLLAGMRAFPRFTEFFQLSVCGALFGIVLFSVQRNLADNALCVTNF